MWHFLNARVQVGELPSSSTHSTEEESIVRRLIGCGLLLLGAVLPAQGQSSSSRVPIPYRTYVAVNPLGIPFNIASAEVE